jgi:hypothetical protein
MFAIIGDTIGYYSGAKSAFSLVRRCMPPNPI